MNDRAPSASARLFLFVLAITVVALWRTIGVPFYTVDDSHTIEKAEVRNAALRNGSVALFFDGSQHDGRRKYPAYELHVSFRLALFGKDARWWHVAHLFMFAIAGLALARLSARACDSVVPGVLAYAIGVFTTTADYQGNAYNHFSTITFEPMLLTLWSLAALALLRAGDGERLRLGSAAFGVSALVASALYKETSGAIVAGTLGIVMLAVWRSWLPVAPATKRPLVLALGIAAALALFWQLHILFMLKRDTGYAGTGALVRDPRGWLETFRVYRDDWLLASWLTLPLGLGLLAARTLLRLRKGLPADAVDRLQAIAFLVGALQLGTLLLWPGRDTRLTLPSYTCFAFCATLELWRLVSSALLAGSAPWGLLRSIGILAGVWVLHNVLPDPWGWRAVLVLMAGGIACLLWRAAEHLTGATAAFAFRTEWVLLLAANFVGVAVINSTTWGNYRAVWDSVEGIRGDVAAYIAANAPRDGRVYWSIEPHRDIIAWSCARNVETIHHRRDLAIGPLSLATELGGLRAGDWIVIHGSEFTPPAGFALRPVMEEVVSGTVRPLDRVSDWHRRLRALLSPHRAGEFVPAPVSRTARIPIVELVKER